MSVGPLLYLGPNLVYIVWSSPECRYFCYWSPDQVFKQGGGLIVPRGTANATVWQRGPHWYEAQRLNSVLKIYGDFLLGACESLF